MNRVSLVLFALLALGTAISPARGQQLKDAEAWARADTNDGHRQYDLALSHWRQHHWQQADSLLRLAARLEPRYPEPYLALSYLPYARRAQLRREERRNHVPDAWRPVVKEAHDFYIRALRIDPMVSLEILEVAYEIGDPNALDYSLDDYQEYLRYYAWAVDLGLGRYRSAYDRLNKLAKQDFREANHPDRVPDELLLYRGLAAAHSFQFDAAIVDFRTLLERALKPQQRDEIVHVPLNDNDYRFMLASLHHLAGHLDSAVALYQQSLEHDLGLGMAHTYLASIYEQTGRPADALLERRRAVEVDSDDPAALYDLATSLVNVGHVGEALDPLYRAIGLNPRYSPPYYLLGRAAEMLKQPDDARDQYRQFLARAPLRLDDLRSDAQHRLDQLSK